MARAVEPGSVAVAESCTGGMVAARIVSTPGSGSWFRGGLVAYHADVKYELLSVDRGPVVTEPAARQMAEGARRLLGANIAVSVTGVAGPETEEGCPVGTVIMGLADGNGSEASVHRLHGDPDQIRSAATAIAYSMVLQARTARGM